MRHSRNHRGSTIFAVLVALLVVMALAGLLVQSIVARQRQLRREEQRAQCQWLAESAVERGAARLKRDAEYAGETWHVTAEELATEKAGLVKIQVEPVEGSPNRRQVKIEANYPDDPVHRIAVRKRILVDLTPK